MIDAPFTAVMCAEPWGVMCSTANDMRLYTGKAWISARGGVRNHYDDIGAGRTRFVDHIEFRPFQRNGFHRDPLGRNVLSINIGPALAIGASAGTIDPRYLRRVFCQHDAVSIINSLAFMGLYATGRPAPGWLIRSVQELR